MKRVLTLPVAITMASMVCFYASLGASSIENPAPGTLRASDVQVSVGRTGMTVNLQELSTMKVAEYERLTGQRLNLIQRLGFKVEQRRLRHAIGKDGTIKDQQAALMAREMDGTTGFHLGGFALGFLLLPIGVLIAYLIDDEKKANRIKWAWIGLAAGVLIWVLIIH